MDEYKVKSISIDLYLTGSEIPSVQKMLILVMSMQTNDSGSEHDGSGPEQTYSGREHVECGNELDEHDGGEREQGLPASFSYLQ